MQRSANGNKFGTNKEQRAEYATAALLLLAAVLVIWVSDEFGLAWVGGFAAAAYCVGAFLWARSAVRSGRPRLLHAVLALAPAIPAAVICVSAMQREGENAWVFLGFIAHWLVLSVAPAVWALFRITSATVQEAYGRGGRR